MREKGLSAKGFLTPCKTGHTAVFHRAGKEACHDRRAPLALNATKMLNLAGEAMRRQFLHLRRKRKTRARSPQEFYGFRAEDVSEIYLRKHGIGRGLWFRLKDGRVIDALGKPSERDRAWYVTRAH